MQLGKSVRMERIMDRGTGRAVIVPMDHGISMGPITGLSDLRSTTEKISQGGATAVVLHKGAVPFGHRSYGRDIGLIVHLSASTSLSPYPNHKVLVCTVEEAIKTGADAVSIHINLGAEDEPAMLADAGLVSRKCQEWGMPLMIMSYPRGKDVKNAFDPELVKICARAASELGADIVKTNYTGDIDSFREVTRGCLAPARTPVRLRRPRTSARGSRPRRKADILPPRHTATAGGMCGGHMSRSATEAADSPLASIMKNPLTAAT